MTYSRTELDSRFSDRWQTASVAQPVVDLLDSPAGARRRQLLFRDKVRVFGRIVGYDYVQSEKDGYYGFVDTTALSESVATTHWVVAPATHAYSHADLKSAEIAQLSFGSRLAVGGEKNDFFQVGLNWWVPLQHVRPNSFAFSDPVAVAELFVGTPYLWGGNSRAGIDCSGLVQAACLACGISCPADSDLQLAALGECCAAGEPMKRGDLLFWRGHVAWVVADSDILHANAHTMSVARENRANAIARIQSEGGGPVIAHKRLFTLIVV